MKKMISRLKLVLVIAMTVIPAIIMAQSGDGGTINPGGGGDGAPTEPINDAELPFDGGVSLLVAAGVAYGLKKVNDKRKAEKV